MTKPYRNPRPTVILTLYSGAREFKVDEFRPDGHASLHVLDASESALDRTEVRIFMHRDQLRELRDVLDAALDEQSPPVALRLWEAVI